MEVRSQASGQSSSQRRQQADLLFQHAKKTQSGVFNIKEYHRATAHMSNRSNSKGSSCRIQQAHSTQRGGGRQLDVIAEQQMRVSELKVKAPYISTNSTNLRELEQIK